MNRYDVKAARNVVESFERVNALSGYLSEQAKIYKQNAELLKRKLADAIDDRH